MSTKINKNINEFYITTTYIALIYIMFGIWICARQLLGNPSIKCDFLVLQAIVSLGFFVYLYLGFYSSKRIDVVLILIYQLLSCFIIYFYYVLVIENPFGIDPRDSLAYQQINEQTRFKGFFSLFTLSLKIDDLGFPIVRHLISNIFFFLSIEDVNLVLIFFDCIIHTIGCHYFYKLSSFYLSELGSKTAMLLWGGSSAIIFIASSGLKEVVFSAITIICIYYMESLIQGKKTFRKTFLFFLFLSFVLLFRIYVMLFILITYICASMPVIKRLFYRYFAFIIIFFVVFSYTGLELLSFCLPALKVLKAGREYVLSQKYGSASFSVQFINFFLGWVSSIPIFSLKATFQNIIAFTYSLIKFYFSFYFIFMVYKIVKKKVRKFYPILAILIFNIVLTIVAVASLDYRFMLPVVYLYYIFIIFFFENKEKFLYLFGKKISLTLFNFCVMPVSLVLFLFYNLR